MRPKQRITSAPEHVQRGDSREEPVEILRLSRTETFFQRRENPEDQTGSRNQNAMRSGTSETHCINTNSLLLRNSVFSVVLGDLAACLVPRFHRLLHVRVEWNAGGFR